MTDVDMDGAGMPDLVQAPSERAIHAKLADPNCPVRELMASFHAAVEDNVSLSDPALKYVRSLGSPKSQAEAMKVITWLLKAYPWEATDQPTPWAQLEVSRIEGLLASLRPHGVEADGITPKKRLSAATVNLRLSIIKGIAREAHKDDLLDAACLNKITGIKRVKQEDAQSTRSVVTADNIAELIESMEAGLSLLTDEKSRRLRYRDLAMIAVLFGSAARRGEIENVTYADLKIDDPTRRCLVVHGKGNKKGLAPLPPSTYQHLKAWLHYLESSRQADDLSPPSSTDPIFPKITRGGTITYTEGMSAKAIYDRTKQLVKEHLGKDASPHALRRGKITATISKHGIAVARETARHVSISTTSLYDMASVERMLEANQEEDY